MGAATSYVATAIQPYTPTLAFPTVANTSLFGGETDITSLITNHLPYIIGIFVAVLALCWVTYQIKRTSMGKKV